MKQARYLAGAVGLAPVAFGTVATAGAPRAPSGPEVPAGHVKTVSLHHVVREGVVPATCDGHTMAVFDGPKSSLVFWYTYHTSTRHTCIGTVKFYESKSALLSQTGWSQRTRIYNPPGTKVYEHYNGCHISVLGNISCTNGVHRSFGPSDVQVCAALVRGSKKSHVGAGPVCGTVP